MSDAFVRGPGGSIRHWARRSGIPRGQLPAAVRDGSLRAYGMGNMTFITSRDLHSWLDRQMLPAASQRSLLEAHLDGILAAEERE